MKTQLFSLGLVTGVLASPVQLTSGQCTTKIDKFDDLPAGSVPLAQNEIGLYNGLQYNRFAASGSVGLPGVAAKSPKNAAGLGLTRSLTTQIMDFLTNAGDKTPIALFPSGTLSAPEGKYFDLLELYFGCKINTAQTLVASANRCDFSATGFNHLDQPVSEETFTYVPISGTGPLGLGAILNADMSFKQFDKFKKMKNVTITLAGASTMAPSSVILLDNVKHCDYN